MSEISSLVVDPSKETSSVESVRIRVFDMFIVRIHLTAERQAAASVCRAEEAYKKLPCLWNGR